MRLHGLMSMRANVFTMAFRAKMRVDRVTRPCKEKNAILFARSHMGRCASNVYSGNIGHRT